MHRDILKLERSGSESVAVAAHIQSHYFQMQNKNVRESEWVSERERLATEKNRTQQQQQNPRILRAQSILEFWELFD